jgi:UDP-N-acetylglucosamine/UDP-N-acetylgalactosamine diphosphorylase
LNPDAEIDFIYLAGTETENRVRQVMRNLGDFAERSRLSETPRHSLSYGAIRRGYFGKRLNSMRLQGIAENENFRFPVFFVSDPDIDLEMSTNYYIETGDRFVVPPRVDEYAREHRVYGYSGAFDAPWEIHIPGWPRLISEISDLIAEDMDHDVNHVGITVLLDGPSGSGKTTIFRAVQEELERRGYSARQLSGDAFLRSHEWRKLMMEWIVGWEGRQDLTGSIRPGHPYTDENSFFNRQLRLRVLRSIRDFRNSGAEEDVIYQGGIYERGFAQPQDLHLRLERSTIVLLDDKYGNETMFQPYLDYRLRLIDNPDRTRSLFEHRTRIFNPDRAELEISFYPVALVPSYLAYAEQTAGYVDAYVDISGADPKIIRRATRGELRDGRSIEERYEGARSILRRIGQEDVLKFWNDSEMTPQRRNELLRDIERVDWEEWRKFKDDLVDHPKPGTVDLTEAIPAPLVSAGQADDRAAGENLLRWGAAEGRAAFGGILVAGGSGARFREFFPQAKGLFKGLPLSEDTLYESTVKKWLAFARRYGHDKIYPLIIMTSDVTHDETMAYFEENKWFGMKDRILVVPQKVYPLLNRQTGKVFMETKWKMALQGGGHGDAFDYVLQKPDVKQWLSGFGVKTVLYMNIDNPLYPLDVHWVGAHARFVEKIKTGLIGLAKGFAIMSEGLIRKKDRLKDKLSELLVVGGVRMPVHYSKAAPELRAQTTHGTPSFRMIEMQLEGTIPIEVSKADKKWDGIDQDGKPVTQEPVWKFERNSDDKISDGANYPFEHEDTFGSIKEPPGRDESPDTSGALQTKHWKLRLERAGYSVGEGFLLQLPWAADFMEPAELRNQLSAKGFPERLAAEHSGRMVRGYLVREDWTWQVVPEDREAPRSELRADNLVEKAIRQPGLPGVVFVDYGDLQKNKPRFRKEFYALMHQTLRSEIRFIIYRADPLDRDFARLTNVRMTPRDFEEALRYYGSSKGAGKNALVSADRSRLHRYDSLSRRVERLLLQQPDDVYALPLLISSGQRFGREAGIATVPDALRSDIMEYRSGLVVQMSA